MWLISFALADCFDTLDDHLGALEAEEGVAAESIDLALACYTEPVSPSEAARVHILYAQVNGNDPALAARHLYAAWEAQPFVVPRELSADVARLLVQLQEAKAPAPVASPASFLQIDGSPSTWTRATQPAIAQGPGRPAGLLDDAHPFIAPVREKKGSGLLVAGVATAAVGGGLYAGAWASNARYQSLVDTGGSNDARQSSHDLTNALSVGSVIGAIAGAGLLTVHVVR